MNTIQDGRFYRLIVSLALMLTLGLSLAISFGCGDTRKAPTGEMPKEKPNLGQPEPPPPLPPPPK